MPKASKKKKSTRGRKPLRGAASVGFTLKLTPGEREAYAAAAEAAELPLAEWIRQACAAQLKR